MRYKVCIPNWTSGLNELLNHQEKRWDARLKKYRVYNHEKASNEKKIRDCIKKQGLWNVKFKTPIAIEYKIYAKDRKHDRMNLGSCLDKCFCDAIHKYKDLKMISGDGWNEVVKISFDYDVDSENPRAEIYITEL